MRKRVFFQNAAIMTITSLLLRSIGIFFRIYVSNRVGAEGMGLYQLIVSVYVLVSSFAASGLSTAVTRLCTDELACGTARRAKRILYVSVFISIAVGAVSGVLVYVSSEWISVSLLRDVRAVSSLKILTLGLPFMGATSCIKGYFYARRKVTSSSIAQILEQIVRIAAILGIFQMTDVQNVESACFAILLGDTIAEASSCLYMALCYWIDKRKLIIAQESAKDDNKAYLKPILSIALPITGGRYLSSGLRTIENMLVPNTLTIFSGLRETALSQFGKLKGMAMPLIFFPSSFLTAFSTLLIPEISEANALKQYTRLKRTIERSLSVTLLSSYLISGVFFCIHSPLSELVYHDEEVGQMLLVLAPLAPIMFLESVVVGILKGLNQQTHSLLYSVLDSASRIVLIVWLVPRYGINGFFGVMWISNLLTCILNVRRLCRVSGVHMRKGKWIIRPITAMMVAVLIANTVKTTLLSSCENAMLLCIVCTVIVAGLYCFLLPVLGCVDQNDLTVIKPIVKTKKSGFA